MGVGNISGVVARTTGGSVGSGNGVGGTISGTVTRGRLVTAWLGTSAVIEDRGGGGVVALTSGRGVFGGVSSISTGMDVGVGRGVSVGTGVHVGGNVYVGHGVYVGDGVAVAGVLPALAIRFAGSGV